MAVALSTAKTVLLAAHCATAGDVDSLTWLAAHHGSILQSELLLRILLTYLPETLRSSSYVPLLHQITAAEYEPPPDVFIDTTPVDSLNESQASKKVKKLRLLSLRWPDAPGDLADDPLSLFLIHRAYRVDEGARLLTQLPDLVSPFLNHSPRIQTWTVSVLLPYIRRSAEYYTESLPVSLQEFSRLGDHDAVDLLLAETASTPETYPNIGRDLKGIIGPWLYNEARWPARSRGDTEETAVRDEPEHDRLCPGFERLLEWLTTQASVSWQAAVSGIEQWDGPGDVDLGGCGTMWLDDSEQEYLEHRYARAALASAYLIPEPSVEALKGAYSILARITDMLGRDPITNLQMAASMLAPLPELCQSDLLSAKNTTYMRNDVLSHSNALTSPNKLSLDLLHATILSAFLLTRAGLPCSVRMAGELALLDNEHEQKEAFQRFIRAISEKSSKPDETYWTKARNEVVWLKDWGAEEALGGDATGANGGVFGLLKKEFIETEFLKALLSNSQYSLARALYEDGPELPLPVNILQDVVITSAMNAYDNASNPNRTRGGVKKCDDILYAFPRTIDASLPATTRIEALLKATHALSDYRLVLKQGEPFTPVVLRVHSDPISIIGKVLEQNLKSYTNMQDMLEIGFNMVKAGLTVRDKHGHPALTPENQPIQLSIAEKRITAMCINAALAEHDFETAYSYVVSKLSQIAEAVRSPDRPGSGGVGGGAKPVTDEWSWKAALNAGKYKRTSKSTRPTHLGTASGNPEIRHLEQRIECLSTALRIAPPATLQEILNTFRRCEEELETALKAEEAEEDAWDTAGDLRVPRSAMPGGFVPGPKVQRGPVSAARAAEDAPLSLFDLARAVAPSAQKNLGALSSLQRFTQANREQAPSMARSVSGGGLTSAFGGILGGGGASNAGSDAGSMHTEEGEDGRPRVRKRDQLRDAAVGTLVSGVGWLVGAQPADRADERD